MGTAFTDNSSNSNNIGNGSGGAWCCCCDKCPNNPGCASACTCSMTARTGWSCTDTCYNDDGGVHSTRTFQDSIYSKPFWNGSRQKLKMPLLYALNYILGNFKPSYLLRTLLPITSMHNCKLNGYGGPNCAGREPNIGIQGQQLNLFTLGRYYWAYVCNWGKFVNLIYI